MHMGEISLAAIAEYWSSLKPNENGLVPAITTDHSTKQVLMMAWMNEESFTKTLQTKNVTYYSRSRNKLWVKGEACHTGDKTCFDGVLVWSEK